MVSMALRSHQNARIIPARDSHFYAAEAAINRAMPGIATYVRTPINENTHYIHILGNTVNVVPDGTAPGSATEYRLMNGLRQLAVTALESPRVSADAVDIAMRLRGSTPAHNTTESQLFRSIVNTVFEDVLIANIDLPQHNWTGVYPPMIGSPYFYLVGDHTLTHANTNPDGFPMPAFVNIARVEPTPVVDLSPLTISVEPAEGVANAFDIIVTRSITITSQSGRPEVATSSTIDAQTGSVFLTEELMIPLTFRIMVGPGGNFFFDMNTTFFEGIGPDAFGSDGQELEIFRRPLPTEVQDYLRNLFELAGGVFPSSAGGGNSYSFGRPPFANGSPEFNAWINAWEVWAGESATSTWNQATWNFGTPPGADWDAAFTADFWNAARRVAHGQGGLPPRNPNGRFGGIRGNMGNPPGGGGMDATRCPYRHAAYLLLQIGNELVRAEVNATPTFAEILTAEALPTPPPGSNSVMLVGDTTWTPVTENISNWLAANGSNVRFLNISSGIGTQNIFYPVSINLPVLQAANATVQLDIRRGISIQGPTTGTPPIFRVTYLLMTQGDNNQTTTISNLEFHIQGQMNMQLGAGGRLMGNATYFGRGSGNLDIAGNGIQVGTVHEAPIVIMTGGGQVTLDGGSSGGDFHGVFGTMTQGIVNTSGGSDISPNILTGLLMMNPQPSNISNARMYPKTDPTHMGNCGCDYATLRGTALQQDNPFMRVFNLLGGAGVSECVCTCPCPDCVADNCQDCAICSCDVCGSASGGWQPHAETHPRLGFAIR